MKISEKGTAVIKIKESAYVSAVCTSTGIKLFLFICGNTQSSKTADIKSKKKHPIAPMYEKNPGPFLAAYRQTMVNATVISIQFWSDSRLLATNCPVCLRLIAHIITKKTAYKTPKSLPANFPNIWQKIVDKKSQISKNYCNFKISML